MTVTRQFCPFHTDEDIEGRPRDDGSVTFRCDRVEGHPGAQEWHWLAMPELPAAQQLTGLAEELSLSTLLPSVLQQLGGGWWEYGLVERAYAGADPDGWQQMVDRWGHTAI